MGKAPQDNNISDIGRKGGRMRDSAGRTASGGASERGDDRRALPRLRRNSANMEREGETAMKGIEWCLCK